MRAVCAEAKLTPRYFYESFRDRDELLLALFDEIAQQSAAVVLAAVAQAQPEPRAKAQAAIGAFATHVTEDPRRARVLFVEAQGSAALTRRRFRTLRMFAGLASEQARDFYGIAGAEDPVIEIGALMLVGGLSEALLAWLDGTLPVSREELVEHCTDLFVATGESAMGLVRARLANR